MRFRPRHWEGVPGVRYPDDGPLEVLPAEEGLLVTHCQTREVADRLGLDGHATRRWPDRCGVPRVVRRGESRGGLMCFFWEREAAEEAVRKYKAR